MPDLRRQALAGGKTGKTVSKKAQSKQASRIGSPISSAAASRNASRAVSRQGSDDEDDASSDITNFSSLSLDDLMSPDEADEEGAVGDWHTRLSDCISNILTRKGSSAMGREEAYEEYGRILTSQYAYEEIQSSKADLIAAFVRSMKSETTEKEVLLALKAFSLTVVTSPDDQAESVRPVLMRLIEHSESTLSKAGAIHVLGSLLFFCNDDMTGDSETLDLLHSVIESDGYSVGAGDSAVVVTAAIENWGLLVTLVDDASELSRQAMDALLEQLQSSDTRVQIAAGETIALLFEKSYTELEPDEEDPGSDSSSSDHETDRRRLVKRYDVYPRVDQVIAALTNLTRLSTKAVSKKDRKVLHSSFADVLSTVENPKRGPKYQKAINHMTGERFGSRMSVTIPGMGDVHIDRWWKLHRLRALRRVLGGGLVRHWLENEVVGGVMEDSVDGVDGTSDFRTDRMKKQSFGYSRAQHRNHLGLDD